MISIDTNILARFYLREAKPDALTKKQTDIAAALMLSGKRLFIPAAVLMELEWVTRRGYKMPREQFLELCRHLAGIPYVEIENWGLVDAALEGYRHGMDYADAYHLAASAECEALATFDKAFAAMAKKRKSKPPVIAPTA